MATTDMEWSFHYSGPKEATMDVRCATCRAGASGECPTHGRGFALGCAHCIAAQGGPCQGHWGLFAAIAAASVEGEGAKADFDLAVSLITNEPTIANAKNVFVTARGSRVGVVRELAFLIRPL